MDHALVQTPLARRQGERRNFSPAVAAVVLVLLALVIGLVTAPGALAVDRGAIFQVGSDVTLARGDVAQSIVAIGGNVDVAGTVKTSVVAVGGDVRLRPSAIVGSAARAQDTSVVLVGGTLTKAPGAQVTGNTSNVTGSWPSGGWSSITDQAVRPFAALRVIAWIGATLLALLAAVIVALLLPRQTQAIADRGRRSFWSSLGWGALSLIVVVPLITVLLIATIVAILAVPAWLFLVFAVGVLGGVGVAALIGELILPRLGYHGDSLVLAAVVGVVVLRLLALIPIVGGIISAVAAMVGFGAAVVALWAWERRRREVEPVRTPLPDERVA